MTTKTCLHDGCSMEGLLWPGKSGKDEFLAGSALVHLQQASPRAEAGRGGWEGLYRPQGSPEASLWVCKTALTGIVVISILCFTVS